MPNTQSISFNSFFCGNWPAITIADWSNLYTTKRQRGVWTDYPISELGDKPNNAPLRKVHVVSYDGSKYCIVKVEGYTIEIKARYLYSEPIRNGRPIRVKGLKRTRAVATGATGPQG